MKYFGIFANGLCMVYYFYVIYNYLANGTLRGSDLVCASIISIFAFAGNISDYL